MDCLYRNYFSGITALATIFIGIFAYRISRKQLYHGKKAELYEKIVDFLEEIFSRFDKNTSVENYQNYLSVQMSGFRRVKLFYSFLFKDQELIDKLINEILEYNSSVMKYSRNEWFSTEGSYINLVGGLIMKEMISTKKIDNIVINIQKDSLD